MKASNVTAFNRRVCSEQDLATFASATPTAEPNCIICGVVTVSKAYDLHDRNILFNPGGALDFGAGGRISFFGSTVGRLHEGSKDPIFLNAVAGRWKQDSTDALFQWPSAYDLSRTEAEFWPYDPAGDALNALQASINGLQATDADGLPSDSSAATEQTSSRAGQAVWRNSLYHVSNTVTPVDNVEIITEGRAILRAMDGFAANWLLQTPAGNRFQSPLPTPLGSGNTDIRIRGVQLDCRNLCSGAYLYGGHGSVAEDLAVRDPKRTGIEVGAGSNGLAIINPRVLHDDPFIPGASAIIVEPGSENLFMSNPVIEGFEYGLNLNGYQTSEEGCTATIHGGAVTRVRLPLKAIYPKGVEWTGGVFTDTQGNDTLAEVSFNSHQNNLRLSGAVSEGFDRVAVTDAGIAVTRVYRIAVREDDPAAFDDFDADANRRGIDFSLQRAYGPPSEHITSGLTPFLD